MVRKWQIRFSGAKSQSIDVFLARLEDFRVLANLTEDEVLSSLSELFTDTAATCYSKEKHKWKCWMDFLSAARRWYGTSRRYQQRWVSEANNRTQGTDEAVRVYITCLVPIMRKLSPPPSTEQQLDLLHRNLKPQIQAMVLRAEVLAVEDLLDLAVEAEQTVEYKKKCSSLFLLFCYIVLHYIYIYNNYTIFKSYVTHKLMNIMPEKQAALGEGFLY